ncbi:hypothetical protein L345_05966, partial [Ophiophagus hannah]
MPFPLLQLSQRQLVAGHRGTHRNRKRSFLSLLSNTQKPVSFLSRKHNLTIRHSVQIHEVNSTDPALVMTSDSSTVEVNPPGLTVPEIQSLGGVEATSSIPDSSKNPTSVLAIKQDERDTKHSSFTTQEEIRSSPTPVTMQQGENITLKTPSREKDSDGSVLTNSKTSILPKDGGKPAQIQPRKAEIPGNQAMAATANQGWAAGVWQGFRRAPS